MVRADLYCCNTVALFEGGIGLGWAMVGADIAAIHHVLYWPYLKVVGRVGGGGGRYVLLQYRVLQYHVLYRPCLKVGWAMVGNT